jgi:Arc/MetJ family transcription regulator
MKTRYDFGSGRRGPVLKQSAGKTRITIRIDDDLLQWFREQVHAAGGGSYQTLLNAALREYVDSKRESLETMLRRVLREELPRDVKRVPVGGPRPKAQQHPTSGTRHQDSIDDQLRFAIANKRLIRFSYLGTLRVAEPHDYGVQKGTSKLLVYQRRGSSHTQRAGVRGWRLLDVSRIEACLVLEETFPGSRGDAHTRHYRWDEVYARVA